MAAKSSIPALEGILLEAQGSRLTMTGYNLETGIRTTVEADIREGGSLVVSARLFGDIIRNLPDDVVNFSTDGVTINIKCGMSDFHIMGTDPREFPELPVVEDGNGFFITQSKLKSMIAQTIFAVSDNESRPIHTGSLFEVESGVLTVVSVDGLPAGPAEGDAGERLRRQRLFLRGARRGPEGSGEDLLRLR